MRRFAQAVAARPWLLTLAVGLLEIAVGLHGPDSPAAGYRTWLVRRHGFSLVTTHWYDGEPLLGYSVIAPPLAALLGTRLVALAACTVSSAALTGLVRRWLPGRHATGLCWFAVAVTADLALGRLAFAVGLACTLRALLAAARNHPIQAGLLAVLSSLASPLAAAFLLLAGAAWLPRAGRRALPLAGAGTGLLVALLLGEHGGRFPFPFPTMAGSVLAAVGGVLVVPKRHATLRRALAGYVLVALVLFAVPNPVGGNITRAVSLLAGPLAAVVLTSPWRRRALAVLALPLAAWQLAPVATAVADSGDPSARPAYYTGLLRELATQPQPLRLEIPFTRDHWEASLVAPTVPLARGWERQADISVNGALYSPALDAASYLRWLRGHGVTDVALPDVPLDPAARREGRLLAAGVAGLQPIWHDAHWRLWRVSGTTPLVGPGGRLISLHQDRITLELSAGRPVRVLLRAGASWQVRRGSGCVGSTPGGWLEVASASGGRVTLAATLLGGRRDRASCALLVGR